MDKIYQLAKNYELGINGVEQDVLTAYAMHCYLAEQGYALSQYWLGKAYLDNLFCPLFQQTLFKKPLLPQIIEKLNYSSNIDDDFEAKHALDRINKCNRYHAKKLLNLAAEQGLSDALCLLGEISSVDNYGCKNIQESKRLFQLAIDQDNPQAMCLLGELYAVEGNCQQAVRLYKQAVKLGCVRAVYNLASCYQDGFGVEKDSGVSTDMLIVAANDGYNIAQYHLSTRYLEGHRLPKNDKIALEWCKKSAEGGYAGAQNSLASRYVAGSGVRKNYATAIEWYIKAIAFDWPDAYFNLAQLYENGHGVKADEKKSLRLYHKAANKGHVKASRYLGFKYQAISATLYNNFLHKQSKLHKLYPEEQELNDQMVTFYNEQSLYFYQKYELQIKGHRELIGKRKDIAKLLVI
jgi:TPR repeat protein